VGGKPSRAEPNPGAIHHEDAQPIWPKVDSCSNVSWDPVVTSDPVVASNPGNSPNAETNDLANGSITNSCEMLGDGERRKDYDGNSMAIQCYPVWMGRSISDVSKGGDKILETAPFVSDFDTPPISDANIEHHLSRSSSPDPFEE